MYVLGPESAISAKDDEGDRARSRPGAERVGAEDPVANAIAFARYADGDFGWNINDPGHGLVIANADRPLDAAAAAPLSASGTWGPLLLTDDADALPAALRGYLLDIKPGYDDDPTRALYNHVWLIGDTAALSVDFQAEVDELAEVAPITSGSGARSAPAARHAGVDSPSDQQPKRPKPMSESERPDRLARPRDHGRGHPRARRPVDPALRAPDPQPDRSA